MMDLPVLQVDGEHAFAEFFAHNPIDLSFAFLSPATSYYHYSISRNHDHNGVDMVQGFRSIQER